MCKVLLVIGNHIEILLEITILSNTKQYETVANAVTFIAYVINYFFVPEGSENIRRRPGRQNKKLYRYCNQY